MGCLCFFLSFMWTVNIAAVVRIWGIYAFYTWRCVFFFFSFLFREYSLWTYTNYSFFFFFKCKDRFYFWLLLKYCRPGICILVSCLRDLLVALEKILSYFPPFSGWGSFSFLRIVCVRLHATIFFGSRKMSEVRLFLTGYLCKIGCMHFMIILITITYFSFISIYVVLCYCYVFSLSSNIRFP